eukprot:3547307-Rhodomonas_salina.3
MWTHQASCSAMLAPFLLALVMLPLSSAFSVPSILPRQQHSLNTAVPAAVSRLGAGVRPLRMKLDVAPQVVGFPTLVALFPTAPEQNEVLAVVNGAIAELNKSQKAIKEVGKASACTYILAAGRPQQGVISVRFNCQFRKEATNMMPGRLPHPLAHALREVSGTDGVCLDGRVHPSIRKQRRAAAAGGARRAGGASERAGEWKPDPAALH